MTKRGLATSRNTKSVTENQHEVEDKMSRPVRQAELDFRVTDHHFKNFGRAIWVTHGPYTCTTVRPTCILDLDF